MSQLSLSLHPGRFLRLLLAVAAIWPLAAPAQLAESAPPSPPAASSPPALPITKEAALRAIDVFTTDPTGGSGRAALAVINRFARESTTVALQISPIVVPWIQNTRAPHRQIRQLLLGAYIAGNTRSQLQRGSRGDDPLAGWRLTFSTYKRLQAADETLFVPEIEALLSEERVGTLQTRAENALKTAK